MIHFRPCACGDALALTRLWLLPHTAEKRSLARVHVLKSRSVWKFGSGFYASLRLRSKLLASRHILQLCGAVEGVHDKGKYPFGSSSSSPVMQATWSLLAWPTLVFASLSRTPSKVSVLPVTTFTTSAFWDGIRQDVMQRTSRTFWTQYGSEELSRLQPSTLSKLIARHNATDD